MNYWDDGTDIGSLGLTGKYYLHGALANSLKLNHCSRESPIHLNKLSRCARDSDIDRDREPKGLTLGRD